MFGVEGLKLLCILSDNNFRKLLSKIRSIHFR